MTPKFGDDKWKVLNLTATTTATRISSDDLFVVAANFITPSTNSNAVLVGPNSDANVKELPASDDQALSVRDGEKVNLKDWYFQVASGTESLKVLYKKAFA